MGTGFRIHITTRLCGTLRFCVYVNIRRGPDRGELEAQGVLQTLAVIDHGGNIHPVAAVIKLRLASGIVFMKRDVKETCCRIGGTNAANPVPGNRRCVLHVNRICNQIIRKGQDLVCVIGCAGGVVSAGGGQGAGGYTKLVQIDGARGLDIKLVRCRFGEAAGTDQVTVDEVIEFAAGNGNPHGYPLVFITLIREIC